MNVDLSPATERYLVTGACGCIGAWTVQRLLERGHTIVTFDLPGASEHRLRMLITPQQLPSLTRVAGDVGELSSVSEAIAAHGVTRVIHLAALQVPFVRANPALGARVNVEGTVNVFEAARAATLSQHIVYASSIAALDAHGGVSDPPSTLYGAFKRCNENSAAVYHAETGLSSVGLRPHTVYGPGRDQGLTSEPSAAMLAAAAGRAYHISFGGSCLLHHARDVAEAFVRASEWAVDGARVHNIDGPVACIAQVVAAIEEAAPAAAGLITCGSDQLPFPAQVDVGSFTELVGGSLCRPLREGVADAVAHYRRLLDAGLIQG